MSGINRIIKSRAIFRSLIRSIYFNFHYLPIKQAVKLPILLYKPKFVDLKGKIVIDTKNVKFGMIRLGFNRVSIFPNSGIIYENKGGTITFKGNCIIGNNSAISLGKTGDVSFGEAMVASTTLKIVSYKEIEIGNNVRFGWDCLIMDTNFHPLKDKESGKKKKASGSIVIGDYNWFANRCTVMHSVKTPERSIYGMTSIVTRGTKSESYCVHMGNPVKVVTRNVIRDYNDDVEKYD